MTNRHNRGEWAELYVFFVVLAQGYLGCADSLMRPIPNQRFVIDVVDRCEIPPLHILYTLDHHGFVTISNGSILINRVSCLSFARYAIDLKQEIEKGVGHAFKISQSIIDFAKSVGVNKPKAASLATTNSIGGKCDILFSYTDIASQQKINGGFSIKSAFSQSATLFNPAKASNFIFSVDGCSDSLMNQFNAINKGSKLIKRGDLLRQNNASLRFFRVQASKFDSKTGQTISVFESNLQTLRPDLLVILPEMLKKSFYEADHLSGCGELADALAKDNPCHIQNPSVYYKKAIKDFLYASFAGMTASIPWNGTMTVNGGYIIVTENWDVLSYSSTNAEAFKDYLLSQTKLDHASMKRYSYGSIVKGQYGKFLALNLQVRFY